MKNDITNMTLARQKLYSMKLIDESKLLDFICELEDLQRQLEHSSAPVCDAELSAQLLSALPESWLSFASGLRCNQC